MNGKKSITIMKKMVDSFKEEFEGFEVGQIFETQRPIYPEADCPKEDKIITFGGLTFTKPLALGKKDKYYLLKEDSVLSFFFKELKFGDLLLVKRVENGLAYCSNLSIKDEIKSQFYKKEKGIFTITEMDMATGLVAKFKKSLPIGGDL